MMGIIDSSVTLPPKGISKTLIMDSIVASAIISAPSTMMRVLEKDLFIRGSSCCNIAHETKKTCLAKQSRCDT